MRQEVFKRVEAVLALCKGKCYITEIAAHRAAIHLQNESKRQGQILILSKPLLAGLKGNTLGVAGTAAACAGTYFDTACGALVILRMIRTLLDTAHNSGDGMIGVFHNKYTPFRRDCGNFIVNTAKFRL